MIVEHDTTGPLRIDFDGAQMLEAIKAAKQQFENLPHTVRTLEQQFEDYIALMGDQQYFPRGWTSPSVYVRTEETCYGAVAAVSVARWLRWG